MGCSSSALNKAGDSSRFRSVTSNECLSTTEGNESCVAQPAPRTPGKESLFYGNIQREGFLPLEKPKASVMPTANGVVSLREQPLAKEVALGKDATDQSGPTEKTQSLQGPEGSEAPQLDSKEDTPGVEEKKKDVEKVTEVQAIKGNAQTELSEAKDGSSGTAGGRNSPRAGEDAENPPTVNMMKPLGTMENIQPLETDGELQPPEAMGKDEQSQLLEEIPKEKKSPERLEGSQFVETGEEQRLQETVEKDEQSQFPGMIPKENKSPEILEGNQLVETGEEQQLRETVGKDEQSQLLETMPEENITSEILDRSQLVQTPVMNDLLHKTSEGRGNTEQIQPERIIDSMEPPEGITEMVAKVEMAGKIHTNKADQHTEGETGEKMETEIENEKISERAETKEEETGEAVDLSAATELGMATEG